MADDTRDILIELRSDMKHVRETLDNFHTSDRRQWDRLDEHGAKLCGHEKSINYLSWGFRTIAGGIVTILVGVVVWSITH